MIKRIPLFVLTIALMGSLACFLDPNVQCIVDTDCPLGATCTDSRCTCPGGQQICNTGTPRCVDLQTSQANCGSCGNVCNTSQVCRTGQCRNCNLAGGDQICSGACVDISNDLDHCGGCGKKCKPGEICKIEGQEIKCGCPTGQTYCVEAQLCVDTSSSNQHCSACGKACPSGQFCLQGQCGVCQEGQQGNKELKKCGNSCPDILTSISHCGACNNSCAAGQGCCNGKCIDVQSDKDNCGACNNSCGAKGVCEGGTCKCSDAKLTYCNPDGCVDLLTDTKHCSVCGKSCGADQACISNKEQSASQCCEDSKFSALCNGRCIKTDFDSENCGSCGNSCQGQICNAGFCEKCSDTLPCPQGLTCDANGKCACGLDCTWVYAASFPETSDSSLSQGQGIAVDQTGNIYVTGWFRGTVQFGEGVSAPKSYGGRDIFVLKLNPSGKLIWVQSFGSAGGGDEGLGLALAPAGDKLYVVGSFTGNASFGDAGSLQSAGDSDLFIAVLDPTGKVLKAQRAGGKGPSAGQGFDAANAVSVDKNGKIFVVGNCVSDANFPQTTPNTVDKEITNTLCLAEYDPGINGFKWARLLESKSARGAALVADADNNKLYVTGECGSTKLKLGQKEVCGGSRTLVVLTFDFTGSLVDIGPKALGNAQGVGIVLDDTSKPFVAGSYQNSVQFAGVDANDVPQVHLFETFLIGVGSDTFTNFKSAGATKDKDGGTPGGLVYSKQKLVIAGALSDTLQFAGTPSLVNPTPTTKDLFVARYDIATSKWDRARQAGGAGDDEIKAIAVDGIGGVYVTGSISGTVDNFATPGDNKLSATVKGTQVFVWKVKFAK